MKLPKSTLILLLILIGLGSFVYFYEIRGASQRELSQKQKIQVFSFTSDDVKSLNISTKNLTVTLVRRKSGERPEWSIQSPVSDLANDAIVSYLMDLLVKSSIERILSIPANQLSEYGLDRPQATIDIQLKNQQNHQLLLGQPDFTGNFAYAEADPHFPQKGNISVLIVSKDFLNAVNRNLSEWKQFNQNTPAEPLPTLPSNFLSTPKGSRGAGEQGRK